MEVIADGPSDRCWWMGQRGRSGDHEKYLDSEYIFKQGKKEMIIPKVYLVSDGKFS